MKPEYVLPEEGLRAFNCVRCHVYAKQEWFWLQGSATPNGFGAQHYDKEFRVSKCDNCQAITIWRGDDIIYPPFGAALPPNPDMPADAREDYEEAAAISSMSPRAAAALLRLAIQKICIALGQPGKNLNKDIGALVAEGLPSRTQQALDTVRVIGNHAVHPGKIDLNDDRKLVNALFKLVNFITEKMFTEPKQLDELYEALPEGNLEQIEKRDGQVT